MSLKVEIEFKDEDVATQTVRLLRAEGFKWLADQIEPQLPRPRIDEPGLWGVVEASVVGDRVVRGFVRHDARKGPTVRPWLSDCGRWHEWDDLIDPVLVREGLS